MFCLFNGSSLEVVSSDGREKNSLDLCKTLYPLHFSSVIVARLQDLLVQAVRRLDSNPPNIRIERMGPIVLRRNICEV